MNNRLLKRLSLTLICVSLLSMVFMGGPVVVSQSPQRGPVIDTLRWKVTRSPAAQFIEMTVGPPTGSDMWLGMIRPDDVIKMSEQGKIVSSTPQMHFCEFGFNYRVPPLDDVNFRHALAHLFPKAKVIGAVFKFVVVQVETPVPPAMGKWYNAYTDPHPFSPSEAEAILYAAGYKKPAGVWLMPDNSPIQTLRVYMPTEITAPTSYTIGKMFCDECAAVGLTSVTPEPMVFSTYTELVFDYWDFEIFWVCWRLSRFPTFMDGMFHSRNNFLGSSNPYGMYYPELDEQLDIFYKGMEHELKVPAIHEAQKLLMGGTIGDPLAIPAQPERDQAIPIIPVYSRAAYDTQQPGLEGGISMYGYGLVNGWTWMNIHWNYTGGSVPDPRPGTTENMVVPILDEFPERLNPTWAGTVYAWDVMDPTYDGLLGVDPYTQKDIPWLATEWSYGVEGDGMWVKYNLRTTDNQGDPVKWQDGDPIDPTDVVFAWTFLHDKEIPNYWDDLQFFEYAEIAGNEITAHLSTTSQWEIYSYAGVALMFPPQVWEPCMSWPTADILSWDPSAEPGPGGLPTKVYGTGPFILQHSTTYFATMGYGDLKANRASGGYWLTTEEIQAMPEDMFHYAGDVNSDGIINIPGDLAVIGWSYDTTPEDLRWRSEADLTDPYGGDPDNWIFAADLVRAGWNYGFTRTPL